MSDRPKELLFESRFDTNALLLDNGLGNDAGQLGQVGHLEGKGVLTRFPTSPGPEQGVTTPSTANLPGSNPGNIENVLKQWTMLMDTPCRTRCPTTVARPQQLVSDFRQQYAEPCTLPDSTLTLKLQSGGCPMPPAAAHTDVHKYQHLTAAFNTPSHKPIVCTWANLARRCGPEVLCGRPVTSG